MLYRLLCIVIGENTPFSVKIDDAELVDDLKKAIKQEPFAHALDASDPNDRAPDHRSCTQPPSRHERRQQPSSKPQELSGFHSESPGLVGRFRPYVLLSCSCYLCPTTRNDSMVLRRITTSNTLLLDTDATEDAPLIDVGSRNGKGDQEYELSISLRRSRSYGRHERHRLRMGTRL
jgi:Crinkler effector protein N-terminal domain